MKLRDHPVLTYRGVHLWPPVWVHSRTTPIRKAIGEIGILTEVVVHDKAPAELFLRIKYDGLQYVGCLLFSDPGVSHRLYDILKGFSGHPIKEIGDFDLSV